MYKTCQTSHIVFAAPAEVWLPLKVNKHGKCQSAEECQEIVVHNDGQKFLAYDWLKAYWKIQRLYSSECTYLEKFGWTHRIKNTHCSGLTKSYIKPQLCKLPCQPGN